MSTTVADTITNTLIPAPVESAEVQHLRSRVNLLEAQLQHVRKWSTVQDTAMTQLWKDVFNNSIPSNVSPADMWDRIKTLVQVDEEHPLWAQERDYQVTVTMTVTVTGVVTARSEEEARQQVWDNTPSFRLLDDGALVDTSIDDESVDNLDVEEA